MIRTSPFPEPELIVVETHNRCNSACAFCPSRKMTRPKGTMQAEEFSAVVSQLASLPGGICQLQPMGGEPLLDTNIAPRALAIKHATKLRTRTHTNLIRLDAFSDAQVVDLLRGFDELFISLAPNEAAYGQLFGTRHYHRVLRNLQRLLDIKEVEGVPGMVRLLGRSAPQVGGTDPVLLALAARTAAADINWTTEYLDWGGETDPLPLGAEILQWDMAGIRMQPCLFALWPAIFWNLDMGLCACADYDARLVFGSLHRHSLHALLRSEARKSLLGTFAAGKLPPYCARCTFYQPGQPGPAHQDQP